VGACHAQPPAIWVTLSLASLWRVSELSFVSDLSQVDVTGQAGQLEDPAHLPARMFDAERSVMSPSHSENETQAGGVHEDDFAHIEDDPFAKVGYFLQGLGVLDARRVVEVAAKLHPHVAIEMREHNLETSARAARAHERPEYPKTVPTTPAQRRARAATSVGCGGPEHHARRRLNGARR